MKAKKIGSGAHKFTIHLKSKEEMNRMHHEMKESPAYERMEKKLMKKYAPKMKMGAKKASKAKAKHGKKK